MKQQLQTLDKAYRNIKSVVDTVPDKVEEITSACPVCPTLPDIPDPDVYDTMWVLMRTYVPDILLPVILFAGLYAVLHVPINSMMGHIFGINFDDLREMKRRRKERDKELKKGKR